MADKEKKLKAEYPLNNYGLGFRSTLENGPYFKDDVGYVEPLDDTHYGYGFCGGCAFYAGGKCEALEEEVFILGTCQLYINMDHELALRCEQFIRQHQAVQMSEDIPAEVLKYISEEGGKYCVRSHQTGKNFGCYNTKAEAKKRLAQIARFKDEEVDPESVDEIKPTSGESVEIQVKFASEGVDEEKRLVYGVVLVPDDVDYHEDTVSSDEIEKAAHKYMRTPMVIGDGHTKKAKANPVESFIYNPDVLKGVKPGSWVMAVKVHSDVIWEGIKDGSYTGFSIGAMTRRIPVEDE